MKSVRNLLVLVAALLATFAAGAASGYAAKGTAAPESARSASPRLAVSQCPAGMHVVVYYTAHTWTCVDDGSGG